MNRVSPAAQLTVLAVLTALLAWLELLFQSEYIGVVPLPLGTVLILLTMPWLVRTAVEAWPTTAGAASVPVLWFAVTAVLGAFGPGGDALLVPTWQTLLLLASGVLVGLFCFRRNVDRLATAAKETADPSSLPSDPRVGRAGKPT